MNIKELLSAKTQAAMVALGLPADTNTAVTISTKVEFGDYQLDTWLFWVDILQFLGEFESAIQTLLQASEYFPEENEVEYRLAGLYFMIQDTTKAKFHLSNAMRLNFDNYVIIEDLFPVVWTRKMVQNYIAKHKK